MDTHPEENPGGPSSSVSSFSCSSGHPCASTHNSTEEQLWQTICNQAWENYEQWKENLDQQLREEMERLRKEMEQWKQVTIQELRKEMTNGKHGQEGGIPPACAKVPLNTMEEGSSSSGSDEGDHVGDDQDTCQPPTYGTTAIHKGGRKGVEDAIAAGILETEAASKLRTAAVRQINARYSIADCIKQLDEMQGVEEEVYFAALNLFKKHSAREIFLSLTVEKRLIWLRGKCTGNPAS